MRHRFLVVTLESEAGAFERINFRGLSIPVSCVTIGNFRACFGREVLTDPVLARFSGRLQLRTGSGGCDGPLAPGRYLEDTENLPLPPDVLCIGAASSIASMVSLALQKRLGQDRVPLLRKLASRDQELEPFWQAAYGPPPRFEGGEAPPSSGYSFEVGDAAATAYLEEHGYVVFSRVLSDEEAGTARGLFWDFVEEHTQGKVLRDRPETWGREEWPGLPGNSLFNAQGIGQSPFMWYMRTRPAVLRAFAQIWGIEDLEDLIVSFDGASAFRPTSLQPAWRSRGNWFHTDQNAMTTGSDFNCVQGLVALYDNDELTGGLTVLPGSHKHHSEIFERWPLQRDNDFFRLPRVDPLLSGPSALRARIVRVRAGDLAVWDSRCVHCSVPARHRFDERPLDKALAEAGLEKVAWPLLEELTSVSDACFLANACSDQSSLEEALLGFGIAEKHLAVVSRRLTTWTSELAADLFTPSSQAAENTVAAPSRDSMQLPRAVAYVCALPRARSGCQALRRRLRLALLGATTTHWPNKCEVLSLDATAGEERLEFLLGLEHTALRLLGCQGETPEAMREDLHDAWRDVVKEMEEADRRGAEEELPTLCGV